VKLEAGGETEMAIQPQLSGGVARESADALTFMGVDASRDLTKLDADVVVIGIPCATPYGHTPDYSKANMSGPSAIRRASSLWANSHDRIDWDVGTTTFFDHADRVVDLGDLPVQFDTPERNRDIIKATTEAVIARGAVPIALGGEDSTPNPVMQGLGALGVVTILQIDAHIDWRDEVNGERWGLSSGMRRASELPFVKTIIQVGMRGPGSAGPKDIADARSWGVRFFTGEDVFDAGIDPVIAAIPDGANVHINFDLDSLDPSIMPAVWVPTPGGLSYWHVSKLIRGVSRRARIASFAMAEFVEDRDLNGTAAPMAARLAATVIGEVLRARHGSRHE
jgi:agmatinase